MIYHGTMEGKCSELVEGLSSIYFYEDNQYYKPIFLIILGLMLLKPNHNINLPTTVGSKSTNTALGTCFPAPVSLKNVLKLSSPPPIVLSDGICPSG